MHTRAYASLKETYVCVCSWQIETCIRTRALVDIRTRMLVDIRVRMSYVEHAHTHACIRTRVLVDIRTRMLVAKRHLQDLHTHIRMRMLDIRMRMLVAKRHLLRRMLVAYACVCTRMLVAKRHLLEYM